MYIFVDMATTLSIEEIKLVTDPEVLLTKNKIIAKVTRLFGELAEEYKNIITTETISILAQNQAKISKGENYKGLPYVVLDYPRQFAKVDVFAIRTFFWWGNFFSITLHLSGQYETKYVSLIEKAIGENLLDDWYLGCADNAWQHHFENNNYKPVRAVKGLNLSALGHIKIAKKIPLTQWDEIETFFKENFLFLIKMLA
jgi:hypothetical protein